jgi:hypothetical protein
MTATADTALATPAPAPDAPLAPAVNLADRRAAALAVISEYRQTFPGDDRSDDELLRAPYGGYELADMPEDQLPFRAERMRRLSLSARKEEAK